MKTKNLDTILFVLVVAIGRAMATILALENIVHAKLKSDPDGPTARVDTGVQCDNSGTQVCAVLVPITASFEVARTGGSFLPNRATCVPQLVGKPGPDGGTSSVNTTDRLIH
jgi:hypothetical protein